MCKITHQQRVIRCGRKEGLCSHVVVVELIRNGKDTGLDAHVGYGGDGVG